MSDRLFVYRVLRALPVANVVLVVLLVLSGCEGEPKPDLRESGGLGYFSLAYNDQNDQTASVSITLQGDKDAPDLLVLCIIKFDDGRPVEVHKRIERASSDAIKTAINQFILKLRATRESWTAEQVHENLLTKQERYAVVVWKVGDKTEDYSVGLRDGDVSMVSAFVDDLLVAAGQ